MKSMPATSIVFLLLTASNEQALASSRAVDSSRRESSTRRVSEPLLQSEECAHFLEGINAALEELLTFDDKVVTDFICNPIQLTALIELTKKMETDASSSEAAQHPCRLAFEQKILQDRGALQTTFDSVQVCRAEMEMELAILRGDERVEDGDGGEQRHGRRQLSSFMECLLQAGACPYSGLAVYGFGRALWDSHLNGDET